MKSKKISSPISVNWHFWPWCNMRCIFCFSKFEDQKKIIPKKKALLVPEMLKAAGTEKITFVGGEPMLCPYIGELLERTKKLGIATKIVSNGTGFTVDFLDKYQKYIDFVGLSIDSLKDEVNLRLGRTNEKHMQKVISISELLKVYDVKLQINTVITKLNWKEDFHPLINRLRPYRWKIFQVLKIDGENDEIIDSLLINDEEFQYFKDKHKDISQAIFEDNSLMIGSYIMLDPLGRFFHNSKGFIEYSQTIFEIGVLPAFHQVQWNIEKFFSRKGIYNWDQKGSRRKNFLV